MGKKTLCRCTALLIVSVLPIFQAIGADEGFIRDQNQCVARNRNPLPNERVTWTGGCKDGLADGVGVQQWYVNNEPGARYEGEWHNGVPDGKGLITSPTGEQAIIEYEKGKPKVFRRD